jgi:hypothetical protein
LIFERSVVPTTSRFFRVSSYELSWNPNRSANQFIVILTLQTRVLGSAGRFFGKDTPQRTAIAYAPVSGTLTVAAA